MIPGDSSDSTRVSWGIPLTIAAVVGGLVIWRAIAGRGEPPAPAPGASASASSSADAPALPALPRCTEVAPPFVIGEPGPKRAPAIEAGAPDEAPEETEDDLAPFAVEIGKGAVYEGGFAAGARRDAEGGAVAYVVTMGLDGLNPKLVKLGRSRGDLDAPVVAGAGPAVLAALLEPNAGGRAIKVAKVLNGEVTWGVELSEGRDESLALDLAASGPRAVVVWDDVNAEDKRSHVLLSSFDVATMRSVTSARPISSPKVDADSPRILGRPGGYWLGYIARAEEVSKKKPGAAPTAAPKVPEARPGEDDDDESGETIQNAWIELIPLDENGAAVSTPRAVTPRSGRALSFDLELGEDGAALLAFRDDDTPQGSSGGKLSSAVVKLGGAIEAHALAEESFGAGVPDLLPGWIAVSGATGATRLGAMTPRGELLGALEPEPSLGAGEPLAATKDAILLARPAGRAMRLGVVRCSPSPSPASPPSAAPPPPGASSPLP